MYLTMLECSTFLSNKYRNLDVNSIEILDSHETDNLVVYFPNLYSDIAILPHPLSSICKIMAAGECLLQN